MTLPVSSMISVEDARERILASFSRLEVERKPLLDTLGQVLAEDIVAPFDIPPLDNTAMDRYAVRANDTTGATEAAPRELRVIANLAAGYVLDTVVGRGEAVRIMTVAPMPPGADAVVPFEETGEPALEVISRAALMSDDNIRLPWIDDDPDTAAFVNYWFARPQQLQLRRLVASLPEGVGPLPTALRVALSRTIVTKDRGASLARDVSHSRPHRVRLQNDFDVVHGLQLSVERIAHALETDPPRGGVTVSVGDARDLVSVKTATIGAVVTSPPYLNAIDYMRGHKLSLVWLGHTVGELSTIRSASVGSERAPQPEFAQEAARLLSNGPDVGQLPNRLQQVFSRYLWDLRAILREVARVLVPQGRAVFVIGNSTLRGVSVDNAAALEQIAESVGLRLVSRWERQLPLRSRYLPLSADTALEKRMSKEIVLSFVPMAG